MSHSEPKVVKILKDKLDVKIYQVTF